MSPVIQTTLMKKPTKTKKKLVKITSKSKVSKKPKISISVILKKDTKKKKPVVVKDKSFSTPTKLPPVFNEVSLENQLIT